MANSLDTIDAVIEAGPFAANWPSLHGYAIPRWYEDAKFGIFIHWGVYSVPAFGSEWYPRNMYQENSPEFKHHVETYGPQSQFGYKDFIGRFTADKFDPDAWAKLFQESGARFIMPVAEHHDGFPMYDSALTQWCASKMGPKRDLIGDLAASVREHGLIFTASSHRAEHYFFFDGGRKFDSDVQDPAFESFYGPAQPAPPNWNVVDTPERPDAAFMDDWLLKTCEIVDKYRPEIVWFDWWIMHLAWVPWLQKFAAYYYNRAAEWGIEVAINYKNDAYPRGTAVFDVERGQLATIRPEFWQTDTSIAKNSWGYTEGQDYKSVDSLVDDLVDIVSKNGALLLNIGPRADGTIPEPEQQALHEIGRWLAVNGEAIYETRPWKIFGEGPVEIIEGAFNDTKRAEFTGKDIRFTSRGETLYAIALAWPVEGKMIVESLGTNQPHYPAEIGEITLLGHHGPLTWIRGSESLIVDLPETRPCEHAFALRITPSA